jgi:ribosomal protein L24E
MKCSYCSTELAKGTGLLYVHRIGTLEYFCSNRCFKNSVITKRTINPKLVKARSKSSAPQKATAAQGKK